MCAWICFCVARVQTVHAASAWMSCAPVVRIPFGLFYVYVYAASVCLHLPAVCLCQLTPVACAQSCVSSASACLRVCPGLVCASAGRPGQGAGSAFLRRARGGGGGCAPAGAGAGAWARRGGGPGAGAGERAALRGPAAAGSNGEAGAAPVNYISGTSIIRGKTRKRWRPAPGGPLPERPGPSLLLRPPLPAAPPPRPAPAETPTPAPRADTRPGSRGPSAAASATDAPGGQTPSGTGGYTASR